VLGTVDVPGADRDQDRVAIALGDDPRRAPDLHAAAVLVVHQQQADPVVLRQVAMADVLPVPRLLDPADRVVVDRAEEAGRAAAVLDVGLAVGARRGEERGVDPGEEGAQLAGHLGAEAAVRLDPGVGGAGAALGLQALDRGGEGDVAGGHGAKDGAGNDP
jgi:hypothetical protein